MEPLNKDITGFLWTLQPVNRPSVCLSGKSSAFKTDERIGHDFLSIR